MTNSPKIFHWLRVNTRLFRSYALANRKLFLIGFVLGSVLIYLSPQFANLFSKKSPTIAVVGNYTPSSLPISIQNEISFGLTTLTSDNEATSGAAVSWQATDSGKTLIFNLDKNLFWQDGTKFDASQINFNLRAVEVKKTSLYSVEFDFKEPFSPLPVILSQPLFKQNLIGLGDFKVESIRQNGRFVSALTLLNLKSGERKSYKFYPTESSAVDALKLGNVTSVENLHDSFGLQNDRHYKISRTVADNKIATIFFNLRNSPFEEKTFRQALDYALPEDFPQGEQTFTSLPKNSWAQSPSIKKYIQNTQLATAYINKIASGSSKPKIILTTSSPLQSSADIIAESWRAVGIPTTIEVSEIVPENFSAHLTYLEVPKDPDQYALWHSTQNANISGYKSFKADRLLEDGRRTFDQKTRKTIYDQFEKAISEDVPAIFLFYPKLYTISRNP